MKKIWLLCLCLASLGLAWCFHVPDEDWLPSINKVKTWDIQKNDEVEQAFDSLVDWIDIISSEWNEMGNMGNDGITTEEIENIEIKDETINTEIDEEIVDNEEVNEETEENLSSDE